MSQSEKNEMHLKIARLMLSNAKLEKTEEKILGIIQQFNLSLELISDSYEKQQVAKLELKGGLKVKKASANRKKCRRLS
jgi:histidine kinase